ncbi:MAG: non-canonical purine NTP pyrophosphatase [Pedosphaera sp.]|nr:non-canonical purine NTP pyrophosphatase [Pedosphaera sp.]
MKTLFIATGNAHKIEEIRYTLQETVRLPSQRDTSVRLEIEETGATFQENALIKSATWAGYFASALCSMGVTHVLADDSGLEVDCLKGAPGVHSARFAAMDSGRSGNSTDAENNAKLIRCLAEQPQTRWVARFRCVLALTPVLPGKSLATMAAATEFFDGTCEGQIRIKAGGIDGFGYDPLFIPEGYNQTFGELEREVKNSISHRARALTQLSARLND